MTRTEEIEYINKIKKGGQSETYIVKKNNKTYVMKEMEYNAIAEGLYRELINEINSLVILSAYPFFVHCTCVNYVERKVSILMEHMTMDLDDFLNRAKLKERLEYFPNLVKCLTHALSIMKYHSIFHGDIKPANVLMKNGTFKLADFGLSRIVTRGTIQDYHKYVTLWYRPPELLREYLPEYKKRDRDFDLKQCDVWSAGIVLLEMCTGPIVFPKTEHGMLLWIYDNSYIQEKLTEEIQEIRYLLNPKEKKNNCIHVSDVISQHTCVNAESIVGTKNITLMESMLKIFPKKRWKNVILDQVWNDKKRGLAYQNELVTYVFNFCNFLNLEIIIGLTILDLCHNFLDKQVRKTVSDYRSFHLDAKYFLSILRLVNVFHDNHMHMETCIDLYMIYVCSNDKDLQNAMLENYYNLDTSADTEKDRQALRHMKEHFLSENSMEELLNCEKEILEVVGYNVCSYYVPKMTSVFVTMDYNYHIDIRKLNNIYRLCLS